MPTPLPPPSQTKSGRSYYRARYYDPASGKFVSEDPLGFYGGDTNLYRYVLNSPSNYMDPEGEMILALPLPVVTGIIGGLAGGLGDLSAQTLNNLRSGRPLSNIDGKELLVATSSGAVAGALAPIAATTWAGAAILGGAANLAQTLVLNHWEHKCSSLTFAFATGALGGLMGGPTSASKAFSTTARYLDSTLAVRSNRAIQNAAATSNFARNFLGGIISNNPPKNSADCGCQ